MSKIFAMKGALIMEIKDQGKKESVPWEEKIVSTFSKK